MSAAGVELVRLWRVAVPLHEPFTTAHGVERTRGAVLVEVVVDGIEGWGECSALARPTYTEEWLDGAWAVLRDELAPAALAGAASPVRGHAMARAGLADAVLDARLRRSGRNLADTLGASRRRLERVRVVGMAGGAVADPAAAAVAAVAAALGGHGPAASSAPSAPGIKLKVDRATARVVLSEVRRAFPTLVLAADANGSWAGARPEDLIWVDGLDLAYLEQPLAPEDLVGHAELARALDTPVALDESLATAGLVETALALGAADVVSVKPARLGGVETAAAVVALCRERGVPAFCGGMLELGVGRAGAAAVAALAGCALPTDLGPSRQYVGRDVAGPVVVDDDGRLVVPEGPGNGVEVDRGWLAEVVDECVELVA